MDKETATGRIIQIKDQVESLKQFSGKSRILTDLSGRLHKLNMYKYSSHTVALFAKESERELVQAMDLEAKKYNKS